jgi:hypothetical protein
MTLATPQYITDSLGQKISVILPIKDYENLMAMAADLGYVEPTKAEILDGIKNGLEEVRLHQEGKIKLRTFQELIDEL